MRWRDWRKCVGENGENYIDANTGAFEEALGITGATRAPDVEMTAARMAAGGRRTDPSVERGTKMIEYDSLITARRHAHG